MKHANENLETYYDELTGKSHVFCSLFRYEFNSVIEAMEFVERHYRGLFNPVPYGQRFKLVIDGKTHGYYTTRKEAEYIASLRKGTVQPVLKICKQ